MAKAEGLTRNAIWRGGGKNEKCGMWAGAGARAVKVPLNQP